MPRLSVKLPVVSVFWHITIRLLGINILFQQCSVTVMFAYALNMFIDCI